MGKIQDMLISHDWYYERSDDMGAWRKGSESFARLVDTLAQYELGFVSCWIHNAAPNALEAEKLYNAILRKLKTDAAKKGAPLV